MKYNGIIENKLRIIEDKADIIKDWNIDSLRDLQENSMLHLAVERALQVAIEAMIDVAERILALRQVPPQDSFALSLKKLQELNILENAADYTDMIRFRNFIVHRYENIDLEIIFNIITGKLNLFTQFVDEIRKS
jgi:uncharacterized protein YutE (UPF0331/DUF86 family)